MSIRSLAAAVAAGTAAACVLLGASPAAAATAAPTWQLEFNDPGQVAPDPAVWNYELGKWPYNSELETYTDTNAAQTGGNLVITANSDYTSSRLNTDGKVSFRYGTLKARIKVPSAHGLWSGFWLLGDDFDQVSWPASGEIDIAEAIGRTPGRTHADLHGPDAANNDVHLSSARVRSRDAYHVYGVTWSPAAVSWFVDGHTFKTMTRTAWEALGGVWVFDQPFHLVLNLAISGGTWAGPPDATTTWPQQLSVDWIRYYAPPAATG